VRVFAAWVRRVFTEGYRDGLARSAAQRADPVQVLRPAEHRCPRRKEQHDRGGYDAWVNDRCTWCGSLHPDRFMEAIHAGAEIGPTDKSYKAYVDGPMQGKFYFQHLSAEQRDAFVAAYNSHVMRIGYPGFFYVPPFFTSRSNGPAPYR